MLWTCIPLVLGSYIVRSTGHPYWVFIAFLNLFGEWQDSSWKLTTTVSLPV